MALTFDPNYLEFDEQVASPATPATGVVRIYVKNDGKFYRKDDTGVEREIGAVTDFLSAIFTEGIAPSTPASGKVATYAKTDGLMYSKDDAGNETLMSGGVSAVKLIASGSLAGVSGVTISSIPAIYTHLKLVIYARSNHSSEDFITVRVGNGGVDALAASYARSALSIIGTTPTGAGDNAAAANLLTLCSANFNTSANRFSTTIMEFPYYLAPAFKTAHYTHAASIGVAVADQKLVIGRGHWLSSSAIDTIGVLVLSSTFATNSVYSLFGWTV